MIIDQLKKEAIYSHFGFGRAKSHGAMWEGNAKLEKDGVIYYFQLWHHGGEKESEESCRQYLSLKGIKIDGKYYDTHWHCIFTDEHIYLHENGWFDDRELELGEHPLIKKRPNINFAVSKLSNGEKEQLIGLGFKIVS